MKNQKSKRKRFRAVERNSLLEKRFKPVVERPKKCHPKVHPLIVIADLRKGVLSSLDRYLAQEGGIRDREIAVELRKLISGSKNRTGFRLLVIEHPEGPKSKGGSPAGKRAQRVERFREIAARYNEVVKEVGKVWRAKELVADEFDCSTSTVRRAVKENAKLAAENDASIESAKNRLLSLAKLKRKRSHD